MEAVAGQHWIVVGTALVGQPSHALTLHAPALFLNCPSHAPMQLRNEADSAIYTTEKSLAEYKAKLPQAVVDEVNKAMVDAREAAKVGPQDCRTVASYIRHLSCPPLWHMGRPLAAYCSSKLPHAT